MPPELLAEIVERGAWINLTFILFCLFMLMRYARR